MAEDVIDLQIWKGDWGLPSVDPACLATLSFCRFAGVPVKVRETGNPWRSPSGELPIMKHRGVVETKVQEIFSYLRKQNYGCDFELSNKQSADTVAFSSMLEEKLLPAVLHLWWIDAKTFVDFTRPWYTKILPFPLKFFIPGRRQKQASMRVYLTKGGTNVSESELETKIYKEAKECMNLLDHKLGNQQFFFGDSPSSLDALVFGYIAPILKAPLPSNQLHKHLNLCDNLSTFCDRILKTYFPQQPENSEERQKRLESERDSRISDNLYPHKKRNMILAAIFAFMTMAGYAILSGLIQIEITDNDNEDYPVNTTPRKSDNMYFDGNDAGGDDDEDDEY